MKKILTISMLLCIILLTGCEQNRLECTITDENIANIKTKSKYVFTFNDEKIKKVTMTTEITLSGDYNNDSFISNYETMASASASSYNEVDGVTAVSSSKKNVVTLKVEMNPLEMGDEALEAYGLNSTKDELKKELTNMGYTCK